MDHISVDLQKERIGLVKNYNSKSTVLILIVLIALLVLLFFLYKKNQKIDNSSNRKNNETNEKYVDKRGKNYIVINDYVYSFFKDYLISISRDITQDDFKYNVYNDNNFIAKGTLKKISKWNILDESGKYVDYSGNLVAYTDNLNVSLTDFREYILNDDDYNIISNLHNDIDLNNMTFSKKYLTDINHNGVQDYLYVIVNEQNPQNGEANQHEYHLIFAMIDGSSYEISYVKRQKNKTYPNFYLSAIFTEDENTFVSFDAKYNPWDIDDDYNMIYRFDNNKFTKVIDK